MVQEANGRLTLNKQPPSRGNRSLKVTVSAASILSEKSGAAFQLLMMVTVLPCYQTLRHVFTAKCPGIGTHFNSEDV